MGIRSYIRDRKQVKASRATESGIPSSWDPASNWDANSVHWESTDAPRPPSPSNKELMDRKKPFTPVGPDYVATEKIAPHLRHNFPEQYGLSDSKSRKPVPRPKPVPPSDRLSSYGDE
jgi:hypothetical protein